MAEPLIGAAMNPVVKLVGPPIKRQFNYLCCFTTNINNLEQEAKELDDAAKGIQVQVDRALDDVRVIVPRVEAWLEKSNEIKGEKTAILDQVPNVGNVCLKLGARFSLSKRAKKTADRMKELRDEGIKFDVISLPGPPAASEPVQLGKGKGYEFESRKQIEEEIMAILRGGDVSVIGICGMGGLGKTTMAKRIMNRVLKENVFEEAVIAVVSQQVDKPKIQLEIGGSLGLNLEGETSEAARMQKLHTRLSGTKKILLVLDDIWDPIELEEFGIPRDSKGCTILITSRNRDTLRGMDVQREFGMKFLSDEEAQFLFGEIAGTCTDDAELKSIAEDIVKECEGLPLALAAVGGALKGEKGLSVWRDALRRLRQSDPDIPYHIGKVYNKLKLSYDLLGSKHAKSLFLLCCLFPEDANIDVERLTCLGMGLGIFEGIQELEGVRDRVSMLIGHLRGRSLLLNSEESVDRVRMHDVVRDVCIYIAKQEGYIGLNDCFWSSSFELLGERTKLPIGLESPNLRLLYLSHDYNPEGEAFKFDNAFFEGISDLYVLCIQGYKSLTSLPPTHSLKYLNSLILVSCYGLETISVVGELVNLEILICRDCFPIEELPLEMKKLNRLKLLDLSFCKNLKRTGQGIISSLHGLEELKMLHSFKRWESEDRKERENARLKELQALTNLRCLEIEIEDPAIATEKVHLSSKIKRFHIIIGTWWVDAPSYNKRMVIDLEKEEACLGNSIEMHFLRDSEYLHLKGNGANNVDLAKCQHIRWLELEECESMKNIITTSMVEDATAVPASLEHLILCDLPKLEGICDGPISSNSFHNLKELKLLCLDALKQLWKSSNQNICVPPLFTNLSSIYIEDCHRLCNLGELSVAGKDCLPQLQELVIRNCKLMEEVFLWNKEDEIRNDSESQNDHCITKVFPKLMKVELRYLPNLVTFYQGMGGFEFPLLMELRIVFCPKWRSADMNDDSSHLFCQLQKVSFANLKKLEITHQLNPFCGHKIPSFLLNGLEELTVHRLYGSMSLFSSSVAGNVVNLRVLYISHCDEMLKVIEDNNKEEEVKVVSAGEVALLFPKLEELQLEFLPKLVTFCDWKCDIKLPLLRQITMRSCPHMENLSLGFLAAPKLEAFTTDVDNNLEIGVNVSFDSLKKLEIMWSDKPFYGHKFFISLFNGLKELQVSNSYRGSSMSCLFTASIARHLDRLELLTIDQCYEVVKVIEDEEKEKAASGGERALLFPKLKKLELTYLPKLVSFCEWRSDIELPSLRNVIIWSCNGLKIFTKGLIATPNLASVRIEDKHFDGTMDLNSVVQQYIAEVEKLQEERKKMEGGEEEEEIKGEIEDGQN